MLCGCKILEFPYDRLDFCSPKIATECAKEASKPQVHNMAVYEVLRTDSEVDEDVTLVELDALMTQGHRFQEIKVTMILLKSHPKLLPSPTEAELRALASTAFRLEGLLLLNEGFHTSTPPPINPLFSTEPMWDPSSHTPS
ncbi:hypothetical protein EW146_g3837 [Bondarzewia mesenterica]|uniref:Uncharacterized protein n=1 Tax=Bondarzewia mesenterica TaxID=1095465 RepID=A0A4S4LWI1_9AGAM|nr:hypothetical protein EW146_g3837 [Bondarzewia mesenterica]